MEEKKKYYVVNQRALPEVLLKVGEAKKLLESGRVSTVYKHNKADRNRHYRE